MIEKLLNLKISASVITLCAANALSLSALTSENQVLHFEAGQAAYSDEGNTLATDGEKVRQWGNLGALGGVAPMLQAEESKRPTFLADAANGLPAIFFDRAEGNVLVLEREWAEGVGTGLDTNTITWTFVFRSHDQSAGQQWIASTHFEGGNSGFGDLNTIIVSNGTLGSNMRDNSDSLVGASPNVSFEDNQWTVVSMVWNGETGSFVQYVNGRQTGSADNAFRDMPLSWEWLVLGNRHNEIRPLAGEIAEFVMYNAALSDNDRLANEAELAEKYGIGPVGDMPFAADFGQVRFLNVLDNVGGADYELGAIQTGMSPFIDDDLTDQVAPASDGDRVRQWRNQSPLGDGIMAHQQILSKRPTYIENAINGHPAIRFNRASGNVLTMDRDDGGEGVGTALDTNTISWTFVQRSFERNAAQQWFAQMHYQGGNSGFGDLNTIITGGGQLGSNMRDNNDSLVSAGSNVTFEDDTWMIVTMVWDGNTGDFAQYINGEQTGSNTTAFRDMPLTWEWLAFGNRHNEIRPWSGDMAEFIMYNATLTDEDRLANERWLDEKYGLGIFDGSSGSGGLVTENQVLHLDAGAGVMAPDPEGTGGIVSMPSELEGKLAFRTANAQSDFGNDVYLAFEVDRPVTVYVASDSSSQPAWLTESFSNSGMTIETTDGAVFDLWQRDFDARDFIMLPGKAATIDDHNYWVILSEGPEVITDVPGGFLADPAGDWSMGRHTWQLTTDPNGTLHTASLVREIANFDPEAGFRLSADFRVPQLQHEGENAYGLLLLGELVFQEGGYALSNAAGIRAEWLPREADGGSTLQLVDHATGQVLSGQTASVSWQGAAPTRTNDHVSGDDQFELFWDSRASDVTSTYFSDDETKEILRMPDGLDPSFLMEGIKTVNDLSNTSDSFLQFTVQSGTPGDGNEGVTVFVAWDIRNSGFEPDWLTENFERTDHLVQVSSGAQFHRLWAAEYAEGAEVTLPGASAGSNPPSYPEGTDNYFVLLGDTRPGLEETYALEAEGAREDGVWTISATLTDSNGHSQTVTATVNDALNGRDVFGLAVRHPDMAVWQDPPVTPIWQTFNLEMDYLTPPALEGFASWLEQHFSPEQLSDPDISGPAAAPAGDGVPNLLKYALDLLPFVPVRSADLPQMDLDDQGRLIFVYWERTDVNDINYIPEITEGLVDWRSGPDDVTEIFRESAGDNIEEVGVRASTSEEAGRGFVRLRVEQKQQ